MDVTRTLRQADLEYFDASRDHSRGDGPSPFEKLALDRVGATPVEPRRWVGWAAAPSLHVNPGSTSAFWENNEVAISDPLDEELTHRRTAAGENRLPPAFAVVVAAVVYALLPESLLLGPRLAIPIVEFALLAAVVLTNPRRMVRQSRWSRAAAVFLASVVIVANLVALGMLISTLVVPSTSGGSLLLGAVQVWLTNVIGFGLLFWELDRGGPVARRNLPRGELPPADWRFSQDENDGAVVEVAASSSGKSGWIPTFLDYLYASLTNSSAFSPTDTMPLTSRAKALMGLEATAALLTSLLVIARAVGSLGGGS